MNQPQPNELQKLEALLNQLETIGIKGRNIARVPQAISDLANAKLLRRSEINEMYENYIGAAVDLLSDINRLAQEAETLRGPLKQLSAEKYQRGNNG